MSAEEGLETGYDGADGARFDYLHCETQSPLHECWKAQDPQGSLKKVMILSGLAHRRALSDEELSNLVGLKYIRHPRLVPIEEVLIEQGRAQIISPWPEATLHERFKTCVANGLPGIPRGELLDYFRSVAEGLDFLRLQHQYLHLMLNPTNIVFMGGRIKVTDFGLAQLAWLPVGQTLDLNGMRYASPEIFDGDYYETSDQYSLAIMFLELTTGKPPFHGHSIRQWREQRKSGKIDLALAAVEDVDFLSRALALDSSHRFESVSEFIEALAQVSKSTLRSRFPATGRVQIDSNSLKIDERGIPVFNPGEVESVVHQLVQLSAFRTVENYDQGIRFQVDDHGDVLHKCAAWLPQGLAYGKLSGFAEEWKALEIAVNEEEYHYRVELPRSMWDRIVKQKQNSVDIFVRLTPPHDEQIKLTEVNIRIRYNGDAVKVQEFQEKLAPPMLYTLRTFLLATSEARIRERYAFEHALLLYPVSVGRLSEPLRVFGKDISMTGIGILSNLNLDAKNAYVQIKHESLGDIVLPVTKARSLQLNNGMTEIGLTFDFGS